MAANRTQSDIIDRMMTSSTRVLRGLENEDVSVLVSAYRRAQNDLVDMVKRIIDDNFGKGGAWDLATMRSLSRDRALFDQINRRLSDLIIDANTSIEDAMVSQYQMALERSGYMIDMASPANMPVSLPVLPIPAIRALANEEFEGAMFSDRIGLITDAMASDIRDELLQSMINGESMTDAASRIEDILGAGDLSAPDSYAARARMIARTEIMRAQNLGRQAVYDDNADIMGDDPQWVVTPDDRLCEWCMRREGLTASEIEEGGAGKDPFGTRSFPPLHPHCRCTLTPRLKSWRQMGIDMPEDMDDDVRGMRDETTGRWTIQPVESFDAWREGKAAQFGLSTEAGDE